MSADEERLQALEVKAAYAEDLLDELNLLVYRQQQRIERLEQELLELRRQMPGPGEGAGAPAGPRDELPPHY
ncbi:SlyX family protein [Melaminivora alkalimesophila]|uniref:SlyX protein n=1 Tax=Melaminivora alkalimesophila TaxID=1165852 RepID=A0A317RAN2_9BURK|nr:SlyX family protein [Melaminivora alkalimesophila]PWW46266.1 SlyX protein [Melaminivora alkalimesophila]